MMVRYISAKQLLISSPDKDVLYLFNDYFRARGQESITVDNIDECLDEIKDRLQRFDVIILDIDLLDIYRIDLAREILDLIPARKLVITAAYDDHVLTKEAKSIGISKQKVLLKPFRFSKLWSAAMDN